MMILCVNDVLENINSQRQGSVLRLALVCIEKKNMDSVLQGCVVISELIREL